MAINSSTSKLEGSLRLLSPTNRNRRDVVINGVRVNEIVELLEDDLGFCCDYESTLVGESGATHDFDIIATKDLERIVINLVQRRSSVLDSAISELEAAQEIQMLAVGMRAKAWDCKCSLSVILRLSSYLSKSLERSESNNNNFMNGFNVKIIEAHDVQTASEKLRSILLSTEVLPIV